MHAFIKAVAALVVVTSSLVFAEPPQGEVVIRTRKGGMVMGRILSETSKGYLVAGPDGTSVVEFSAIEDLRQLAARTPTAEAPPPAPPPVEVAPVAVRAEAPPRPPERPAEPTVEEVINRGAERMKGKREGFHFGLGLGAMWTTGPLAQLELHFEVNFGRAAYRGILSGGLTSSFYIPYIGFSADNLFQYHVGDVYAFGAGLKLGTVFGRSNFVYVAPIVQPVLLTLGDRGQHQFSLTASVAVLSSLAEVGHWDRYTQSISYTVESFVGTVQGHVGYTYLF